MISNCDRENDAADVRCLTKLRKPCECQDSELRSVAEKFAQMGGVSSWDCQDYYNPSDAKDFQEGVVIDLEIQGLADLCPLYRASRERK